MYLPSLVISYGISILQGVDDRLISLIEVHELRYLRG